jgi:hypothetical protein
LSLFYVNAPFENTAGIILLQLYFQTQCVCLHRLRFYAVEFAFFDALAAGV